MYYRQFMKNKRRRSVRKLLNTAKDSLLIICLFIIIPGIAGYLECHDNYTAIVRDNNCGEILIEDTTGNLWTFEDADYQVGDKVKVTFYTNHTTDSRTDDVITKVIKINK